MSEAHREGGIDARSRFGNRAQAVAWSAALALLAYGYWYGFAALDPTSIDWLSAGDPATAFLGWHFFRFEPWGFPLASIRNYGEGLNASVITTDSIPWLALVLKGFSALLPTQFQYFGWWVLLSYFLTALASYAILGGFTDRRHVRILGALLVVMVPFVTWRAVWHLALVAQWQILCALWLYLQGNRPGAWWKWALLLVIAVLTHVYLFAIVGAVWAASLLDAARISAPRMEPRRALATALATILLIAVVLWAAGAFSVLGHAGLAGYGYNQFDLTSFFDSRGTGFLAKGSGPMVDGQFEDFQYLGLGNIVAVGVAVVLWLAAPRRPPARMALIALVALALLLFAASNRITVASRVLFEIPLPDSVQAAAAIFRASARMAWLFAYLMLVWAFVTIATQMPPRSSLVVLASCVLLTFADGYQARANLVQRTLPRSIPHKTEQAALVSGLPDRYTRLAAVPVYRLAVDNIEDVWGYAVEAAPRRIAMNVAYLGRANEDLFNRAQRAELAPIMDGARPRPRPDTLYVTRNPQLALAVCRSSPGAAMATIGADTVVAPEYPADAALAHGMRRLCEAERKSRYDLEFKSSADGRFHLGTGWSFPHGWGTWSDGPEATLLLPVPDTRGDAVTLRFFGMSYSHQGPQHVDVLVNGQRVAQWEIAPSPTPETRVARIPETLLRGSNLMRTTFAIRNPQQPSRAPGTHSRDDRHLGLALVRIQLE